jgi:hypothetical protein
MRLGDIRSAAGGGVLVALLLAGGSLAQAVAPPPPAAPKSSLEIVNRSSMMILHVQISSLTDAAWSTDKLGTGFIDKDASFTVADLEPGLYDVRLVKQTGAPCTLENVAVEGESRLEIDDQRLDMCFEDALRRSR